MCRDKPARCEGVQVSDSEGLANHAGPESCASLGNGVREALAGERAGRVWSPEMANLGADALRTRGRPQRGRRDGKASPPLAGSEETSGMRENTVYGTREALHLAWPCCQVRTVHPRGTTVRHGCRESDRFRGPRKAFAHRSPPGPGGAGGGKGAGQGERGGAYQGPDTGPGHPCHPCPTAYGRHLRVLARQTRGRSPVR